MSPTLPYLTEVVSFADVGQVNTNANNSAFKEQNGDGMRVGGGAKERGVLG